MAHVDVSPDAVASIGAQVAAAASIPAAPTVTVSAPAQDPVSVGVTQTLAARASAITQYSAAASAITGIRADMVAASASGYRDQEQVNQAILSDGGGVPGAAAPSMPTPAMPPLPAPVIPPPSIGAPPTSGRAIAELIHSGAGPQPLFAAAQQMRAHAADLSATASQLRQSANNLGQEWDSDAGQEAASRISELGTWYDTHAQHASAAAAAFNQHGDNFGRARTAIPTPAKFDDLQRRLEMAIAANKSPGSMGRFAPVIAQLQAELGKLNAETLAQYGQYSTGAADPSVIGDPLQAPPHPGGVQAAARHADPDDWFEGDGPEYVEPGGPEPGPSLKPGGGIPAELVSFHSGDAPLSPQDTTTLPPYPPLNPPAPGGPTWNPDGSINYPDYPPYVPESQFDASQGVPRSTIDGIHGTSPNEPRFWAPSTPGELPPYWTKDYMQLPDSPNYWVPDTRPAPPGQTYPA